jgi:hypothetical protein
MSLACCLQRNHRISPLPSLAPPCEGLRLAVASHGGPRSNLSLFLGGERGEASPRLSEMERVVRMRVPAYAVGAKILGFTGFGVVMHNPFGRYASMVAWQHSMLGVVGRPVFGETCV